MVVSGATKPLQIACARVHAAACGLKLICAHPCVSGDPAACTCRGVPGIRRTSPHWCEWHVLHLHQRQVHAGAMQASAVNPAGIPPNSTNCTFGLLDASTPALPGAGPQSWLLHLLKSAPALAAALPFLVWRWRGSSNNGCLQGAAAAAAAPAGGSCGRRGSPAGVAAAEGEIRLRVWRLNAPPCTLPAGSCARAVH